MKLQKSEEEVLTNNINISKSSQSSFEIDDKSFDKLPKNVFSKDFQIRNRALFNLPYQQYFSSLKVFKEQTMSIAQNMSKGFKLNFKLSDSDFEIQSVFLDNLKCYITTTNGKIMQKGYFEQECIEFDIITKVKPQNIKKSIFQPNYNRILTIEEESNLIFQWCLNQKKCIKCYQLQDNLNDIIESEENIIACSDNILYILKSSTLTLRYILKGNDSELFLGLVWDQLNNILYTYGVGIVSKWDILSKARINNLSISSYKNYYQTNKPFVALDVQKNVLIYFSYKDLIFIDLDIFEIKREIRLQDTEIHGAWLENEQFFMFYLPNKRKLGIIFDYSIDPFYHHDYYADDKIQKVKFFYQKSLQKDYIIFGLDQFIYINTRTNFKPRPILKQDNQLQGISCERPSQLFYWGSHQKIYLTLKDQQCDQKGDTSASGSVYLFDQLTEKTIKIFDTDFVVRNLVYCTQTDKLFVSGRGILEYDINTKILKKFDGVDDSQQTYELIVDSNLRRIIYTTNENIYLLNYEKLKKPKNLGKFYPNKINYSEQRNWLHSSGKKLQGWNLSNKKAWQVTKQDDNNYWSCITLDCDTCVIYAAKGNQIFYWDIKNYKELGLFQSIDSHIITMKQEEQTQNLFVCTKNKAYIFHKQTKQLLDVFVGFSLDFTFQHVKVDFKKRKIYTIQKQDNGRGIYDYYLTEWGADLRNTSIQESYFLKAFFGNSLTLAQFLNYVRIFYKIYSESLLLRSYFNFYFIAALHNLPKAIEVLYNEYNLQYPFYSLQQSPLKVALILNNIKAALQLVQVMSLQQENMFIKQEDMQLILESKETALHDFLPSLFVLIDTYPNDVPLQKLTQLKSYNILKSSSQYFTLGIYQEIIQNNDKLKRKIRKFFKENSITGSKRDNKIIKEKTQRDLNPTSFYKLTSQYNFTVGTDESIDFLKSYADTKSRAFVLSQYKYVILKKWDKFFWVFFVTFLINISHTILFSFYLYSAFYKHWARNVLFIFELILISLIIMNEVISFYALKDSYFKDFLNYFDICSIAMTIIILFLARHDMNKAGDMNLIFYYGQWFKGVKLIALAITYFRALLYFRIFGVFRYLLNMILSLTKASFSTIFIVIFLIVSDIFMDLAIYNHSLKDNFEDKFFIIFGEMPSIESWEILEYIPFVVFSVFVVLILINFLIAKLSNKYSELENKQIMIYYQDMATQVLETECIIRKFSKKKTQQSYHYYFSVVDSLINQQQNDFQILSQKMIKLEEKFDIKIHTLQEEMKQANEQNKDYIRKKFEHIFDQFEGLSSLLNTNESRISLKQTLENFSRTGTNFYQFDLKHFIILYFSLFKYFRFLIIISFQFF